MWVDSYLEKKLFVIPGNHQLKSCRPYPGASRWGLKFQAKIAPSFLGAILLS